MSLVFFIFYFFWGGEKKSKTPPCKETKQLSVTYMATTCMVRSRGCGICGRTHCHHHQVNILFFFRTRDDERPPLIRRLQPSPLLILDFWGVRVCAGGACAVWWVSGKHVNVGIAAAAAKQASKQAATRGWMNLADEDGVVFFFFSSFR